MGTYRKNALRKGATYQVQVVLSAPDKLRRPCPQINSPQDWHNECGVRHVHQQVNCGIGVVYEMPVSCGKSRGPVRTVHQHQAQRTLTLSLKSAPLGHLAVHVRECEYHLLFARTIILRQSADKRTREIGEAQVIATRGDECVSAPSVNLRLKKLQYLQYFSQFFFPP